MLSLNFLNASPSSTHLHLHQPKILPPTLEITRADSARNDIVGIPEVVLLLQ